VIGSHYARPAIAQERMFEGQNCWITGIVFSPDGELISAASVDGTVRVWATATGKELAVLKGHVGPVLCHAFSSFVQRKAVFRADVC
jgi:WD40 repeat protein